MQRNPSVLHVSTYDNWRGSGRSAYRIHRGLKECGLESRMLVGWKFTDDEDVGLISNSRAVNLLDRISHRITNRVSFQYLFFPSSFLLSRHSWFREADIIQFYNTHGGYFSHTVLPSISRRRHVIWRLSDMWPMTGHCAYSYDCHAWKTGCRVCPRLEEYPPLARDATSLLWHVKKWIYKHSRLTIVAPSKWIAKLAIQSPLLSRFPVHLIPNSVDTTTFRPIPNKAARDILNIPADQKAIFLGTPRLDDPRKGGGVLASALERLANAKSEEITILLAGRYAYNRDISRHFPIKYLGQLIGRDSTMALAYSGVDVFVLPTLADNFPNTILESMACGTPVVSFNVGGIAEAITHMETGYLANPNDSHDLAKGIQVLLKGSVRSRMSRRCREVAEQEYCLEREILRFDKLYSEILRRPE